MEPTGRNEHSVIHTPLIDLLICNVDGSTKNLVGLGAFIFLLFLASFLSTTCRCLTIFSLEFAHDVSNKFGILRFEPEIGLPFLKSPNLVDLGNVRPNDVGSLEPTE